MNLGAILKMDMVPLAEIYVKKIVLRCKLMDKKEYLYQNLPTSAELKAMDNMAYMRNLAKCWDAATEAMQAKLDAKDKELKGLHGFARQIYIQTTAVGTMPSMETFRIFNIIDEDGKPTPLLTGDDPSTEGSAK